MAVVINKRSFMFHFLRWGYKAGESNSAGAGAGALFVGGANASDIYTSSEYTNSDLLQPVRLVCDDSGRCFNTRGRSRVIVRDSYNYMPRDRFIERRHYRDWDEGPRAGIGFRAPGVSVGVGSDRY